MEGERMPMGKDELEELLAELKKSGVKLPAFPPPPNKEIAEEFAGLMNIAENLERANAQKMNTPKKQDHWITHNVRRLVTERIDSELLIFENQSLALPNSHAAAVITVWERGNEGFPADLIRADISTLRSPQPIILDPGEASTQMQDQVSRLLIDCKGEVLQKVA